MKRFLFALVCFGLMTSAASADPRDRILVFAAASAAPSIQALAKAYEMEHDVRIDVSAAATSTLARQVARGAPADIFISANVTWMNHLEARRHIKPVSRTVLLGNELVLVGPTSGHDDVPLEPEALAAILADGRLAIADPDHVPAGIYAQEALTALGLWSVVRGRLAPASNVVAALNFVVREETPLGIVYATDALANDKVQIVARFPAQSHAAIVYEIALVEDRNSPAAAMFLTYLQSGVARATFEAGGFRFLPNR